MTHVPTTHQRSIADRIAFELGLSSYHLALSNVTQAPDSEEAAHVFDSMVIRLAEGEVNGERFRPKTVEPRVAGNETKTLTVVLAEQDAYRAEAAVLVSEDEADTRRKAAIDAKLDRLSSGDVFETDSDGNWSPDPLALIVRLHRDELRARLFEHVDRTDSGGITRDQKAARLAAFDAELLELQREEAALRLIIAGSDPEGPNTVAFRVGMDPLAALGIEVVGRPDLSRPTDRFGL